MPRRRNFQVANRKEVKRQVDLATAEYRTAETIKPGQQNVEMQLARTLASSGDFNGAQQLYRQVIDRDKTFQPA